MSISPGSQELCQTPRPTARDRQRQGHPPRPAGSARPAAYAALDLGTNNCRMLVARPTPSGFDVIESVSRPVTLGPDLERTGTLSGGGVERVLRTMRLCAERLKRHDVGRMHLVATEACRQARNGPELVARVARETGLVLEIIAPELEARLAMTSCAPLVCPEAEHLLVFDIGGGSTELIWIDLSTVAPADRGRAVLSLAPLRGQLRGSAPGGARIVDWISIPSGVATLHQRFEDVGEDRARFALMSWYFEEMMAGFRPVAEAMPALGLQLIGTSGTVTTIAAAHLGLQRYSRDRVDGRWMTMRVVEDVIESFLAMGRPGRLRMPAIGPGRADLILSGTAILQALLRLWPVPRLRVADRGLREGLLYAMMHEDGLDPGHGF